MTEPEFWYRYEFTPAHRLGDSWLIRVEGGEMRLDRYMVLKHTPKGVWISKHPWGYWCPHEGKRFVLKDSHKKFACATEADALESFIQRKRRQRSILRGQLDDADAAWRMGKELQGREADREAILNLGKVMLRTS